MNRVNLCLATDSYKVTHAAQYPPDATRVYSYFESRGCPSISGQPRKMDEIVFFGIQMILDKLLAFPVEENDILLAKAFHRAHFGRDDLFNERGWRHILYKHDGYPPVRIKAVPEGTVMSPRNVMMTVENTDPEVSWITNWLETILVQVWYPCTVATLSREVKRIILRYLHETGDPSLIPFKLHDFGYRGSTSIESAGIGGLAHLVNFLGTDTLAALEMAQYHYGELMAGFSIPAAEHSTMTSWGGKDFECDAMENMLDQYPTGLVACVSDSYDIFHACSEIWGKRLKDKIMARDGTLVIRPDSGDPVNVIVRCLSILWDRFGGKVNEKGYRVLDPHVRLIQGDGIKWQKDSEGRWYHTVEDILYAMKNAGFSADNIAFGSGGGLLQEMTRDTFQFAFKCCAIERKGVWHGVKKDPVTQKGKESKAGRMMLVTNPAGELETIPYDEDRQDLLQDVYVNGDFVNEITLAEVRDNAAMPQN